MADIKITDLSADTTPVAADLVTSVKSPFGAGSNKKVTCANLKTYMSNAPTLVTPEIGVATGTSVDMGGTTVYGSRAITVDTGGVFNVNIGSASGDDFTVDTTKLVVEGDTGQIGIGIADPTAMLHLLACTTAAGTAPLKFNSGALLTTAEAGAIEFVTDAFYGTITSGAARKTFAFLESPSFTTPTIGSAKSLDDQVITLGTTVTNAATKITLSFDKTATGIGQYIQGTTADPQVLIANPGATVMGHQIAIQHSAGAGNCDDLIGSYVKTIVTGSGDSGLTVVGSAPRCYVGVTGGANNSVVAQAYAIQPWAKHEGTGAITAMSATSSLVNVGADNFTASTVNSGHFHITGAATVTGQFDGVMIEVYPDVTSLDSGLAIAVDSGAVVEEAIRISGSPVAQMLLSSGAYIYTGTAATRAAVRTQVGDSAPIGSMYIGVGAVATTKPYTYIKVTNVHGDTDWERVVTQAAD